MEQALTPFPQFGGYFPVYESDGTSFYNAVQIQAEKRFSNGLSYLTSITLGANNANTAIGSAPYSPNGLNAYNPKPEFVRSYIDQAYATSFVATYQLPVGLGQKYLNSRGIARPAVGWLAVQRNRYLFRRQPDGSQQRIQPAAGERL